VANGRPIVEASCSCLKTERGTAVVAADVAETVAAGAGGQRRVGATLVGNSPFEQRACKILVTPAASAFGSGAHG